MAHLDTQLRAKHQVAPRRIEFAPARHPEAVSFQWNPKYPPINGNTAPINARSTDSAKNKADNSKNNNQVDEHAYEVPLPPAGLQWSEKREMGCGLENLGNTCFLNSALQCLTYTPPLANLVLQRWHSKACRKPNACLACELERHIYNALTRKRNTSFAPKNIVGNLKRIGKHFRLGRQEDSHEFIRYLIEGVQRAMSAEDKLTRVDQGGLFSVFGGYLQSQVKCQQCGYESNTIDPVLDISLEIKSKHIQSIQSALTHFCAPEILDGDNKYKCPRCNKKVRAQKQFTIRQPPHVLTLQLKRFGFMGLFGGNNKITKTIQYPDQLTLDPYLSQQPHHAHVYSLYGVLVHTGGSTHSGHYFSFVRAANQQWYRCDDHHVSQVSHATALQQNAYLLFYVKNERAAPVTGKSPLKSPNVKQSNTNGKQENGHSVTPVKHAPVKQAQHGTESNGHVDESKARVNDSPVPHVKQSNANDKPANGHSVTPVNQSPVNHAPVDHAPKSIRGSGEWRVRDLSALNALLNGNHVTPVSEKPVQHSANAMTPEATAVKMSSPHVNNSKPSSDSQSNTASVTRVKVSAAPSPKSVVEQLQTLGQSHASAWDVPDGAHVLAEQQALVQHVTGAKRKRDEYDVDYDRGKVKKSKRQHIDPFHGTAANPFQAVQNHAIASKRSPSDVASSSGKKHNKKNKKRHFKHD